MLWVGLEELRSKCAHLCVSALHPYLCVPLLAEEKGKDNVKNLPDQADLMNVIRLTELFRTIQ